MVKKVTLFEKYQIAKSTVKDPILNEFINKIWPVNSREDMQKHSMEAHKTMIWLCYELGNKSLEDITWEYACEVVKRNRWTAFFFLKLIRFSIINGFYKGDYKEQLSSILNSIKVDSKSRQSKWDSRLFVGTDVKYLVKLSGCSNSFIYIRTDNDYIFSLLKEFAFKDQYAPRGTNGVPARNWFFENVQEIMGNYSNLVHKVDDFNYSVFKRMEDVCRSCAFPKETLSLLYRFFAFLIENKQGKSEIFKKSDPIDYYILKRTDLAQLIISGYVFIYYNPRRPVPNEDRWLLHINGFDKGTTRLCASVSKRFDFTQVKSSFYKDLLKEFVWRLSKLNFNSTYEQFIVVRKVINALSAHKKKKGTDEAYISIDDAYYIRMWISNLDVYFTTKTVIITALRGFLSAVEQEKMITVEFFAGQYLKEFGKNRNNNAVSIPDKDMEALNKVLLRNASKSILFSYYYIIFHILIQTEFRVSQICHLDCNCISETIYNGQYLLSANKISRGEVKENIVTSYTKDLINEALNISKEIREECKIDVNRKYLFLYKSVKNRIAPPNAKDFREYMQKCCQEIGLPKYSAQNLRDYHMTKAQEDNLRKGRSDVELNVLTGHAHVDITRNHYIESNIIDMVEQMYGIIIGNVDSNGKVVKEVDNKFKNSKHIVENGCGYCEKENCYVESMISCFLCEHFFTSAENLPVLNETVNNLDKMISDCVYEHDKEDLVNKKRLIASYIVAIKKRLAMEEEEE